jgi:hypothetical protein
VQRGASQTLRGRLLSFSALFGYCAGSTAGDMLGFGVPALFTFAYSFVLAQHLVVLCSSCCVWWGCSAVLPSSAVPGV